MEGSLAGEYPSGESRHDASRPQAQREGNQERVAQGLWSKWCGRDPKVGGRDNPEKMRETTEEAARGHRLEQEATRTSVGSIGSRLDFKIVNGRSGSTRQGSNDTWNSPQGKVSSSVVNRIIDSGRLENYGTPAAQKVRDWRGISCCDYQANQKPVRGMKPCVSFYPFLCYSPSVKRGDIGLPGVCCMA